MIRKGQGYIPKITEASVSRQPCETKSKGHINNEIM